MQITTLIIAPVFFTASLYFLLGVLIKLLGRQSSILSARMYAIVFVTCDVISLVVQVRSFPQKDLSHASFFCNISRSRLLDTDVDAQAVGGAMASQASGQRKNTQPGTNVMMTGVVFQLASMTIFAGIALDFIRRSTRIRIPPGYIAVMAAMFISLIAVYIRSIFRAIELAEGWTGYLMLHERYFIALDGSLMALAVGVFLLFDPARIIPKGTGFSSRSSMELKTSTMSAEI